VDTSPNWQVLISEAITHKHSGNIDAAIDSNLAAIEAASRNPAFSDHVCTMLNYLADLFTLKGDDNAALASIREAIRIARDIRSALLPTHLLMSAGILLRVGRPGEAKAEAEEALRLCTLHNHAYGVSRVSELLGKITGFSPASAPPGRPADRTLPE
jgi:tetratricopeptide (TPR) repeat protein